MNIKTFFTTSSILLSLISITPSTIYGNNIIVGQATCAELNNMYSQIKSELCSISHSLEIDTGNKLDAGLQLLNKKAMLDAQRYVVCKKELIERLTSNPDISKSELEKQLDKTFGKLISESNATQRSLLVLEQIKMEYIGL